MAIPLIVRSTYKLFTVALMAIVGIFIFIGLKWYTFLKTPITLTTQNPEHLFLIEKGSSVKSISKKLSRIGVVEYPAFFEWLVLSKQASRKVQAGEYLIENGLYPSELLNKFIEGHVYQYAFTIVEGWDFETLMKELHKHPKIQKTLLDISPQFISKTLNLAYEHPEGLFYPETYHFPAETTDVAFLKRANESMKIYLKEVADHFEPNVLKNPYEVLVLASIIEKESSLDSEYRDIAGVYIRRLHKGMRLQADPTVNYAVRKPYTQPLTVSDLAFDSPYNTYRRRGLPPTPIGMPSRKAIQAALNPAEGTALYFVATGEGGHQFSDSLAEHNQAVKVYRLWLKEQKAKGVVNEG